MIGLVRRDEVQQRISLTALIYKLCLRGTYGIKVKSLNSEADYLALSLTSSLTEQVLEFSISISLSV